MSSPSASKQQSNKANKNKNRNKNKAANKAASTGNKSSSSSSATPKTILDLPELPTLTIFDYLPLVDLFHVDEVCRAWGGKLKSSALSRRRTLMIVHRKADLTSLELPNLSFDMLRMVTADDDTPFLKKKTNLDRHALYASPVLSPTMIDRVTETLPNLTGLHLLNLDGDYRELWKIKLLFSHYRHQLQDLTLWFWASMFGLCEHHHHQGYEDDEEDQEGDIMGQQDLLKENFRAMYASLCSTLNSMTALQWLQLNIQMPFGMTAPSETVNIGPVARRLRTLNIRTYGFSPDGRDSLVLKPIFENFCEPNDRLEALYTENPVHLETLLGYGPRVTAALGEVHLKAPLRAERLFQYGAAFQALTNLRELSLTLCDVSVASVARPLVGCPQLVHISLSVNFDPAQGRVAPANDLPIDKLPVIKAVRALSLFIDTASHRDFERMNLDILFPNVQVILLRHTILRCTECNYALPQANLVPLHSNAQLREFSRYLHECMRRGRLPLARLLRLKVLRSNIGYSDRPGAMIRDVVFKRENLDRETFQLEERLEAEGVEATVAAAAAEGLVLEVNGSPVGRDYDD